MSPFVSHVEWLVTDLSEACAFFEGLLGWQFTPYSRHYCLYSPAQGPAVGLLEVAELQTNHTTLIHIQVPDLQATLSRAVALGATVRTPPTFVPGHGHYAHVIGPHRQVVGLFTPSSLENTTCPSNP